MNLIRLMRVKIYKQFRIIFIALAALWMAQSVAAQSSDQNLPTAVLSNEVNGTIAALDLGDPRLTRHFYAFEGTPGDLLVTLDSRNLNGDLDIFTAVTLRPLMKISMYANTASPQVTKSFYLRSRQILILRVEARTPSDESGSYHIHFGGSFEPFSGGIPVAEASEQSTETSTERKTNVSSVGARIEESNVTKTRPTETPAEESANAPSSSKPKTARANPPTRTTRGRVARSTRNRPVGSNPVTAKTEATKPKTTEEKKRAEREEKSGTAGEEKSATPAKTNAPEAASAQPAGPRLIIERNDGSRIERPMATVRRVVVEGGVIVVVLKTGRIERVPLSGVARMAIEP